MNIRWEMWKFRKLNYSPRVIGHVLICHCWAANDRICFQNKVSDKKRCKRNQINIQQKKTSKDWCGTPKQNTTRSQEFDKSNIHEVKNSRNQEFNRSRIQKSKSQEIKKSRNQEFEKSWSQQVVNSRSHELEKFGSLSSEFQDFQVLKWSKLTSEVMILKFGLCIPCTKMFEFRGLNMLTLRFGPFQVDKFSFHEKQLRKILSHTNPIMAKIFKMLENFGFDLMTFRIGPFGVNDEKFS